jgi:hypothetical protein
MIFKAPEISGAFLFIAFNKNSIPNLKFPIAKCLFPIA